MFLSLSGCASSLSQAEIKFLETRDMDLPYAEAYQAAANGLFSLGYTIEHSDKASGILSGRLHKKKASLSVTFLLILPLPTVGEGTSEEAVTFMLTQVKPHLTRLRMKLVRDGKPLIDRKVMTRIWQRIEREALLESRPAPAGRASARRRSPARPSSYRQG
ncbi:MAG: hypothetical protein D6788_09810 [Planctomycetota bacterium]|nr:MAG: hypothetical protein D6788_09810 [Planctomycetota bacterium]